MATMRMMNIKENRQHLYNSIAYILKPEKTECGLWIGGNAGVDKYEIYRTMIETKKEWGKPDGRQGYHYTINFPKGEVNEALAYKIIKQFCEEYLGDEYDYAFAIHNDRPHMHGHIVFNSVSRTTGYKYRYKKGDWEKSIQPITDRICKENGVKELVFDKENRINSKTPYLAKRNGKTEWMNIIRADIDNAIKRAADYQDFFSVMEQQMGYGIRWGYSYADKREYVTFHVPGGKNGRRDKSLGAGYKWEDIQQRILNRDFKDAKFLEPKVTSLKMSNLSYKKSRYQVRKIKRLHHAAHYHHLSNPFAIDQKQVREDMAEINKLRDDCRYLIKNEVHSVEQVQKRLQSVTEMEGYVKAEKNTALQSTMTDEAREYLKLEKRLRKIPADDDSFEEILNRMEELEDTVISILQSGQGVRELDQKLMQIRKEKRILMHCLKGTDPQLIIQPNVRKKVDEVIWKKKK